MAWLAWTGGIVALIAIFITAYHVRQTYLLVKAQQDIDGLADLIKQDASADVIKEALKTTLDARRPPRDQ